MILYLLLGITSAFVAHLLASKYKMTLNRLIMENPKIKESITESLGKKTCEFLVDMVKLYDHYRPKFSFKWLVTRPSYKREESIISYTILIFWFSLIIFSIIPSFWSPVVLLLLMVYEYFSYWRDTFHYTVKLPAFEKEFKELYDRTKPTFELG